MRCQHCGAEIPAAAAFCPGCGTKLDEPDKVVAPAGNSPAQQLQQRADQVRAVRDVPEQELWRGSYSHKAMAGTMAISGAVTICGIVAMIAFIDKGPVIWGVLGALLLLWGSVLAVLLRRRLGIRYRLTNQRFFVERGIFSRVTDRIEVIDINDMQFEQKFSERLLDVGSITISSTDRSTPKLVLQGIEHVEQVFNLIDQARRAERNRRGLYIESS